MSEPDSEPGAPAVRAFLRRYEAAFSALDADAIADCYALPCAFLNPLSRSMVESPEALQKRLTRLTRVHRRSAWARAEARLVALSPHGGHFVDARVHWTVYDGDGGVLWDFEHGYLLELPEAGEGEPARIVAAIGY